MLTKLIKLKNEYILVAGWFGCQVPGWGLIGQGATSVLEGATTEVSPVAFHAVVKTDRKSRTVAEAQTNS